ncbi:MAG: hypothetical protein ABIH50_03600 [bacterium]
MRLRLENEDKARRFTLIDPGNIADQGLNSLCVNNKVYRLRNKIKVYGCASAGAMERVLTFLNNRKGAYQLKLSGWVEVNPVRREDSGMGSVRIDNMYDKEESGYLEVDQVHGWPKDLARSIKKAEDAGVPKFFGFLVQVKPRS